VIWLNVGLLVVTWAGILMIQYILMRIAAFFEKNSGKPTWYRGYLFTILLSGYGAGRYAWQLAVRDSTLNFSGDPLANLTLFCAGLGLLILGKRLYVQMMGDQRAS